MKCICFNDGSDVISLLARSLSFLDLFNFFLHWEIVFFFWWNEKSLSLWLLCDDAII